ncbi:hypothetical protein RJ639_004064 [Escallonia herrerae]|uniref:PNPLA domain-containing protein n=1 Tax=Escallonia herrerae TaxID=1293975 RepID=A0AA88VZ43_9ASTE|nr:hypothetical protein RJ639_004064 [Escallonia herrerae]
MELSKVTMEIFSKLEQKWLYHCEGKKTRVLSIDGGRTTGIVTDFFNIVTGTGIGALFAAMLTADNGDGRPLYSAKDAVAFVGGKSAELYMDRRVGVFCRQQMFSDRSMDRVLKKALVRKDGKALTPRDTCKPLLVLCFDLNSSEPFVFSRADSSESPSYDFELWKVCRARSANPSMLKPFALTSVDEKTSCLAVHGGTV